MYAAKGLKLMANLALIRLRYPATVLCVEKNFDLVPVLT
jgi:hypothetical protein